MATETQETKLTDKAHETLTRLPVFQPVVGKILALLSGNTIELRDVARLVEADPGLATDVLFLANSPLFGFASSIRTMMHALIVLGIERVQKLVLAAGMRAYMKPGSNKTALARCWKHSLATAVFAEELAPSFGVPRDLAHSGGLMHDIGRVALISAYRNEYQLVLGAAYENIDQIRNAERATFDVDHCAAGQWLTRVWRFPADLSTIAAAHHDQAAARSDAVGVVGLGCRFAHAVGFDTIPCRDRVSAEDLCSRLPNNARRRLESGLEECCVRVSEAAQTMAPW